MNARSYRHKLNPIDARAAIEYHVSFTMQVSLIYKYLHQVQMHMHTAMIYINNDFLVCPRR